MRKLLFVIMVIVFTLVSCSKNENVSISDQSLSKNDIPAVITNYVNENYPDTEISYSLKLTDSDTSYLLTLTTAELLAFDQNLNHIKNGGHHFCPSDSVGDQNNGNHHGGGFPIDSLSSGITDYISINYADYTIRHARFDTLCQFGDIIEVMISLDNQEPIKLIFNSTDTFLAKANRILYTSIPSVVTNSINVSYPGYSNRSKAESYTLADNSMQYKAFVYLNESELGVVLNEEGTIVCESEFSHHGGGHHGGGHNGGGHQGGHHDGGGIPIDSLPASITEFITTNFSSYNIYTARIKSLCQFGTVTEVVISTDSLAPVKLFFNNTNIYLAKAEVILTINIPAVVTDLISATYIGYSTDERSEINTLADNSVQFEIKLHLNQNRIKVVIKEDGTIVCVE